MFRTTFIFALMASVIVLGAIEPVSAQSRGESASADSRDDGGRGDDGGNDNGWHLVDNTGGRGQSAAIEHDSDPQLDVWVTLCNEAGGGMSTDGEGNYTCTGSDGNEIEDY